LLHSRHQPLLLCCCSAAVPHSLPCTCLPTPHSMVEQQTAAQPSSRPAASKRAVASLPILSLESDTDLQSVGGPTTKCPVCTEELALGDKVQQLPCKHCYHVDCLKPWLQQVGAWSGSGRPALRQCGPQSAGLAAMSTDERCSVAVAQNKSWLLGH
jgi:hypothetical protein